MTIPNKAARKNLQDMAGGKRQHQGKSAIPDDVIEAILSKLPVKSLIRFQTLSKYHKGLISNPRFSRISYNHLSKSPHTLFLHFDPEDLNRFCLMRLESGSSTLQRVAELGDLPFGRAFPLCSCNGVVLLSPYKKPCREFVLWNPSIRRHTVIPIPAVDHWINPGFYHDSGTDDYKVVIIIRKGSMVYSCKTRIWSEEELIPRGQTAVEGHVVDGCLYWLSMMGQGDILCFDFKERKMEKLEVPAAARQLQLAHEVQLTVTSLWWGRLCLLLHPLDMDRERQVIWVRENGGWREVIDVLAPLHEDKTASVVTFSRSVINNDGEKRGFIVYDYRIEGFKIYGVPCYELMPYSESLLFPFEGEERRI